MNNTNPIYLIETVDPTIDPQTAAYGWAGAGISALVLRFFKLRNAKQLFLSEYPTPKDLQSKLEKIMDRNPAARQLHTKLDGMSQSKYIWWVKMELLHSYNLWRILGNFLLGPIGALHQGSDMVKNKYFTTGGDMLNNVINKQKDMDRMYYQPAKK